MPNYFIRKQNNFIFFHYGNSPYKKLQQALKLDLARQACGAVQAQL